jgi:hypothetical protein
MVLPVALTAALSGRISKWLAFRLDLPRDTGFSDLERALPPDGEFAIQRAINGAVASGRMDLTKPAFPKGLPEGLDFGNLPLKTRTRKCLENAGLLACKRLGTQTLGDLLSIRGFGVDSLINLLNVIDGLDLDTPSGPNSMACRSSLQRNDSAPHAALAKPIADLDLR